MELNRLLKEKKNLFKKMESPLIATKQNALTAKTLKHISSHSNSSVNLVQLSHLANEETGPQR